VAPSITRELICEKIEAFSDTLRILGFHRPRIAVCGVNPHCGDGGIFGEEDQAIVAPAIKAARQELSVQCEVFGPVPADTAFHLQMEGQYDGVLAQYHDQALGPLKTVHFYDAVNITGALPWLRVSPDHGPAEDRFESKAISFDSMKAALALALQRQY
jgi:4-hydroxythreonine-4-phosphate dehydrogenase